MSRNSGYPDGSNRTHLAGEELPKELYKSLAWDRGKEPTAGSCDQRRLRKTLPRSLRDVWYPTRRSLSQRAG